MTFQPVIFDYTLSLADEVLELQSVNAKFPTRKFSCDDFCYVVHDNTNSKLTVKTASAYFSVPFVHANVPEGNNCVELLSFMCFNQQKLVVLPRRKLHKVFIFDLGNLDESANLHMFFEHFKKKKEFHILHGQFVVLIVLEANVLVNFQGAAFDMKILHQFLQNQIKMQPKH